MKAILEFDLNDIDDKRAHEQAISGASAHLCLWEIDQFLRSELKYSDLSDQAYKAYEKTREELVDIMQNNKVFFQD